MFLWIDYLCLLWMSSSKNSFSKMSIGIPSESYIKYSYSKGGDDERYGFPFSST